MEGREDFCFSVSATTRKPRPHEREGVDYYFVEPERFQEMIEAEELLEYALYVSNHYGTPRRFVEEQLDSGKNVILDIEIQGARQVYEKMPDAITIFILPPSMKELRRRLTERGTDTPEAIEARILRASQEILEADFYRYLIVNDQVEVAAEEFRAILKAEQCRYDRELAQYISRQE